MTIPEPKYKLGQILRISHRNVSNPVEVEILAITYSDTAEAICYAVDFSEINSWTWREVIKGMILIEKSPLIKLESEIYFYYESQIENSENDITITLLTPLGKLESDIRKEIYG